MKKLFLFLFMSLAINFLFAQDTLYVVKEKPKPPSKGSIEFSFMAGYTFGNEVDYYSGYGKFDANVQYYATLEVPLNPAYSVQLMWTRYKTSATIYDYYVDRVSGN